MRQRTIAARKRGGRIRVRFEPGTSHRPYFVTRPVALWLYRRLTFPNWTEAASNGCRRRTSANGQQAHNAPMDRGIRTEQREGGAGALGTGIPVPSRDDLNAVEPAEWRRDNEKYVLEGLVHGKPGARRARRNCATQSVDL